MKMHKISLTQASLLFLGALCAPAADLAPSPNPWTFSASTTLKESFDSNVYIQDAEPTPANAAVAIAAGLSPVDAKKESFVLSVTPSVGAAFQKSPAFKASLSYSPEVVRYHSAASEDHVAHRGALSLGGQWGTVSGELVNSATYIDGSTLGPTFVRPGDCPAIGGIPLRDRREAFCFRNGFKLSVPLGEFFIRPVASAYIHDFKTQQRANTAPSNFHYENYIDRQDINGGLDVGFKVAEKTFLVAGYRYGEQDQYKLLAVDSPYDSSYHRILVGIEGTPWSWLKLAVLAGPDIRDFSDRARQTYPAFDDNEMLYWIDATVTLLPTENDAIILLNRRYEQPAFSSHSVYEDITYDITWKHRFDDHWAASTGFRLYIGDWQAPVNREDYIYTPSVSVAYAHNKHLSSELAYSYDWVESQVSNTSGREFTRHIVSLFVKYAF